MEQIVSQSSDESPEDFFADKAARFFQENNWILILGLIAYLAVIPFMYRQAANQPSNPDPFLYGQVAKEMLQGKRLYSETWQDKPPLAFVPYMLPGALGFHTYLDLGFVLGVWLAIEGGIFFIYFRRNLPAALGCVFFLTLFPMTDPDFSWPSTEHFANPFVALMLLLGLTILRRRGFRLWQSAALGVLAVVTFHIRQNAVITAVLPLAAMLCSQESRQCKIRALAIAAAAGAICWSAILIWVWRIGDLRGYAYTVFKYPRLYAHCGSLSAPIHLFPILFLTHLPLLFFFCAAIAMLGKFRRAVILSLVVAAMMIALPMRGSGFGHYWAGFFPFIAVYLALAMESSALSAAGRWVMVGAILFAAAGTGIYHLFLITKTHTYADLLQVDAKIESLVPPNSTLLVIGDMDSCGLVYCSHLPAANTYSFVFQLEAPQGNILPKPIDGIFADYLKHPPDVIFITDDDYNQLNDRSDDNPPNPTRLIRMLVDKYTYRTSSPVSGFHLLVRNSVPARNPGP
jgi:hypothetical protein